jgi:hypothetical protein
MALHMTLRSTIWRDSPSNNVPDALAAQNFMILMVRPKDSVLLPARERKSMHDAHVMSQCDVDCCDCGEETRSWIAAAAA